MADARSDAGPARTLSCSPRSAISSSLPRVTVDGTISGLHRSPFHGYSAEFSQYRHYRPGDDLKYIDWKLFARTDRLYTKQFRRDDEPAGADRARRERVDGLRRGGRVSRSSQYARLLAAALAHLVSRQGDAVGLVTFDDGLRQYLPSRGGQAHLRALLVTLRSSQAQGRPTAPRALRRAIDLLKRRGLLLVISDLYDEDESVERALRRAAHIGHEVVVFHVLTRDEVELPFAGEIRGGRPGDRADRGVRFRGRGALPSGDVGFPESMAHEMRDLRHRLHTYRDRHAARFRIAGVPAQAHAGRERMIVWLNPMALAGIGLAAVPILIDLLRQHRAERIPFPSVRFIHPSLTAAVRLRRVQDPWLLLVRAAILAAAACALAQPVMLTPARLAAWNARVSRAVVVDTSGSMRLHGAEAAAGEAARAEVDSASAAVRFDVTNLRDGLRQASVWLATAPPGRREVAIVSDFQAGALRWLDLRNLPGGTGVRGIQVGSAPAGQAFTGMALLGRGSTRHHEIRLEPALTHAAIATGSGGSEGLRPITAAGEDEAVARLMRSVSSAGTPAPSAAQPIALVLAGGRIPSRLGSIQAGWMRSTAARLMSDRDLLAAAAEMRSMLETSAEPWTVIVRDSGQRPLVRAASSGPELVIDVAAPAGELPHGVGDSRDASRTSGDAGIHGAGSRALDGGSDCRLDPAA